MTTKRCYAGCKGECRCYPEDDSDFDPEQALEAERHAWDDLKFELEDHLDEPDDVRRA